MKFLQPNRTPIALDVQAEQIVAVQLVRRRGTWRAGVCATIQRDRPRADAAASDVLQFTDTELTALERALSRQGASGREIALMAPSGATCVELLELPPRAPGTPIDQLSRAEMARLARWDDATPFQLTSWDVPAPFRRAGNETRPTTSLYAAALPESAVLGAIAQLAERGWSVRCVLPSPLAAAAMATDPNLAALIVDARWDRAALTLVRDGVALYHRDLPDNGLALLARSLVADLQMSADEAAAAIEHDGVELGAAHARSDQLCESFAESLASELDASLAFATRRYGDVSIGRLLLVGAGAHIGGLAAWLGTRLDIATTTSAPTNTPVQDASTALCAALAIAAADARTRQEVGLLPGAVRNSVARERIVQRWALAAAAIAAVGVIGVGALLASNLTPTRPDEARLAGLASEQARLDSVSASVNHQLADLKTTSRFYDRLAAQPDYSDVLRLVSSSLNPSTELREIALTSSTATTPQSAAATSATPSGGARHLKLVGLAPEASALTAQVAALRAIDVFNRVELARTGQRIDSNGVSFEMSVDVGLPTAKPASPKGDR